MFRTPRFRQFHFLWIIHTQVRLRYCKRIVRSQISHLEQKWLPDCHILHKITSCARDPLIKGGRHLLYCSRKIKVRNSKRFILNGSNVRESQHGTGTD